MKGFKLYLFTSIAAFWALSASASVQVTSIKLLDVKNNRATISIGLSDVLNTNPEVSVREGLLQVALPEVTVWPKIEKKVTLSGSEATLMAYQFDKSLTRFRALIPYSLVGMEKDISLQLKDRSVIVNFPVINQVVENYRAPAVVGKAEDVVKVTAKAADYDESYLETLLKDKKEIKVEAKKDNTIVEDKVAVAFSATDKSNIEQSAQGGAKMEMMSMVGKFTGFLIFVVGIFFALINIFKRSVLKKGKLGFLNNTDVVNVLNTTYVGPKKSLLLVKVHRQVFLLSNDEKGVTFLSEVNDVTGLLKNGEEVVAGSNFDTTLVQAATLEKDLKLKEMNPVVQPEPVAKNHEEALNKFLDSAPVRDQVKFSEQIKNKVKNLKALQ